MLNKEVFALPLSQMWLLYAPLHDLSALLNTAALTELSKSDKRSSYPEVEKIRLILTQPPVNQPGPREAGFDPDFLGLITTRQCNIDCKYCGFRVERDERGAMSLEMIDSSIDWYARHLKSAGREIFYLHFFGGEPLYEPELVRAAVQTARKHAGQFGMQAKFEISTNGVMREDVARFVAESINHVVLSLDGPADIHEFHRPAKDGSSTFANVYRNAKLLSEGKCSLHLRACVTSETVGRMEEIANWFRAEFKPSSVCFETLQQSLESEGAGIDPPDPWEFALGYVQAAAALQRSGIEPVYATADIATCRVSFCPVGSDAVIISPDGAAAGCYLLERDWQARGLDLSLGRFKGDGELSLDEGSVERLRALNVLTYERCRNCFCRWHCAGACHVNHSYPGCGREYDDLCIQTRVITLFRILEDLGRGDVFKRFAQDRGALRRAVLMRSDRL